MSSEAGVEEKLSPCDRCEDMIPVDELAEWEDTGGSIDKICNKCFVFLMRKDGLEVLHQSWMDLGVE